MWSTKKVEPFEEPVEQIALLLDNPLSKERQALSRLCGVLRVRRPEKIVKIGKTDDMNTFAILKCIQMLELDCQLFIVDSRNEKDIYSIFAAANLERFRCKLDMRPYRLLFNHTFAGWTDVIGSGIDFLLLDAVNNMPEDVLNFIVAAPYLKQSAVVALYDAVFTNVDAPHSTNKLFRNIFADKYQEEPDSVGNMRQQFPYVSRYVAEMFEMNSDILKSIREIFVLLKASWNHVPRLPLMMEYAKLIGKHYDLECIGLYQQGLIDKSSWWIGAMDLLRPVLSTFPHVLLYGKGERGQCFLQVAKAVGIDVDGFIVSDDRHTVKAVCGLPVYEYSRIPFAKEEVFIIQTAFSREIEDRLRQSEYHWVTLPEKFWEGG